MDSVGWGVGRLRNPSQTAKPSYVAEEGDGHQKRHSKFHVPNSLSGHIFIFMTNKSYLVFMIFMYYFIDMANMP